MCSSARVPYATAAVNLLGSLAIGLLAGLIATGRVHMSTELRTFVFVGILGGFTTFSSYMLDTFTLGHAGEHALAFWNMSRSQTAHRSRRGMGRLSRRHHPRMTDGGDGR